MRVGKTGWAYRPRPLRSANVVRDVTLVLTDPAGSVLGALPPYPVATPWWQDAAAVVDGAKVRYGLDVSVLRLLTAQRPQPPGGAVTYVVEVAGVAPSGLRPADVDLTGHPLRADWARPGGPAASLAWATGALAELGRTPVTAVQQRTWNLSAIWRLDGPRGSAWLKQVPPFLAHEAAVLRWLGAVAPTRVPVLLAAADRRMLLAHVPGEDRYDAGPDEIAAIQAGLHELQRLAIGHADMLVAVGVPDLRGPRLVQRIRAVVRAHGAGVAGLDALVDGLDARLAAVAGRGLPDTLVHGDFHPGNARSDGTSPVIVDWGDSFVGHPAFDALRLVERLAPAHADRLVDEWTALWRAAVPGCDPVRALRLLQPVAALRLAAVYAGFVDAIEPSERPYHAADVDFWLREAVAAAT
jgi:hypothetical protein